MKPITRLCAFSAAGWRSPPPACGRTRPRWTSRRTSAGAWSGWPRTEQADGHWEANGGQYPTTMTALAGMALLMEGSTIREGKYSQNISGPSSGS